MCRLHAEVMQGKGFFQSGSAFGTGFFQKRADCMSERMEASGTSLKGGPMTNKFTVTREQMAEILRKQTDFSKIGIFNDVMFCSVFRNPEDCKELLQRITGLQIAELYIVQEQKSIKTGYLGKGVRLDVYAKDVDGNSYDIEMQVMNTGELPLRSRYYHSQMDNYQIQTGQMYTNLQKSMVIFICGFDLFGQNRSIYTFETVCRGKSDIVLDDKRKTIFVNIGGDRTEIEKEAADLLDYFRTGNPTDTFTKGLQTEVEKIRQDTEWRENYMTYEMKIELQSRIGREKAEAEARAAGMAEGLAEGKAQGMAEGLAEGKAQGMAEGLAEGKAQGIAEGEKSRDRELILKWLQKGRTMQEIAEDLDRPEKYVRKLAAEKISFQKINF